MSLEERIAAGDSLAAYDVIVECREQLEEVQARLGVSLCDDHAVLSRLRDLERAKPARGCEPVIDGGRRAGRSATKQETAAKDRGGKERRRTVALSGAAPRATAGKRAGGRAC